MAELTAPELLDFEAKWGRHTGKKELAILDDLGMRPARYYQLLTRAVRSLEGIAHDPMTCRRVRDETKAAA